MGVWYARVEPMFPFSSGPLGPVFNKAVVYSHCDDVVKATGSLKLAFAQPCYLRLFLWVFLSPPLIFPICCK